MILLFSMIQLVGRFRPPDLLKKRVRMKIVIEKTGGKLTETSRDIFAEKFRELPDGKHLIESKRVTSTYTPTRYKYYFDAVMWLILQHAGNSLMIISGNEQRHVESTKDVHAVMKLRYNGVTIVDRNTGEVFKLARSTTNLSDRDFIGEYTERIIEEYAGEPHYIEFPDYEEWKLLHKERRWNSYKEQYLTTI